MRFQWDPQKAESNVRKHGVSFAEATTVFRDTLSLTGRDPDHSERETRYLTFGYSSANRILVVSHTDTDRAEIRIISARLATKAERTLYEEG